MAKTCSACRSRKMRCDGMTPICGPCSRARKPLDCSYISSSTLSSTSRLPLLQKGAACLPCRRKKKKCDASKPFCTTCKISGKDMDCQYENEARQSMTTALLLRTRELEQRLAEYESQETLAISIPQDHVVGPVRTVSKRTRSECTPPRDSSWLDIFVNAPIDLAEAPIFDMHPWPADTIPSDVLHLPIPRPISNPLVPSPDPFDLRTTFLSHNVQVGIYLRPSKWRAVKEGDCSGEHVHPAFVHLGQLLGGLLWNITLQTQVYTVPEELDFQNALCAFDTFTDPTTMLQLCCLFSWYSLYKGRLTEGSEYIAKGLQVARKYCLQFGPAGMGSVLSMAEPDDDMKEQVLALSQLAYLDKAATIVLKMPSVLKGEFDNSLRDIPILQPWLTKRCVIILRARSTYFLEQAFRLAAMRVMDISPTTSSTQLSTHTGPSQSWYKEYWELLEDITQHLATATTLMLKATIAADRHYGTTLKVCLIVTMAAQIELHRLSASYHSESRQKCIGVIHELVGLTEGIKDDDYVLLDPILGTCWTVVATTLHQHWQLFVELSSEGEVYLWRRAITVMMSCASKLSERLPFMENALQTLCEIVTPKFYTSA